MMKVDLNVNTILSSIVLAAISFVAGTLWHQQQQITRIETLLSVMHGDNWEHFTKDK